MGKKRQVVIPPPLMREVRFVDETTCTVELGISTESGFYHVPPPSNRVVTFEPTTDYSRKLSERTKKRKEVQDKS